MSDTGSDNPLWGSGWRDVRRLWSLDSGAAHLNHGSYGAVPIHVREVQDAFRAEVDSNPERWFRRRMPDEVVKARTAIAGFLGASADAIALVANASAGASTVLANLGLAPGDEIIITNHTYGAVRFAAQRRCQDAGGALVTVDVRAGAADDEILGTFDKAITGKTRLIVVDQITSDTAMLFPIAAILALAHSRGVPVLVDGAHAPGMLDVDLDALDPDFWVGNLHKWCCAPHGTAVLYVAEPFRAGFRTLAVGTKDGEAFPRNFDYTGTADFTAWLAAPAALALLGGLGWDKVRRHNAALCAAGQHAVAAELGIPERELWGSPRLSMRALPLPPELVSSADGARALQARLAHEFALETVIKVWGGAGLIRLSAHVYNALPEYEKLAHVLGTLAHSPKVSSINPVRSMF
ncbi:MAG TPA: aminotransferase class V-fold PLP-dependent enzyme [Burkholderiaceae bacterium]|nr:aminotransferase class V-fold PLP-dependent enzyme [Burkholderiaceae bacterium]